MRRYSPFLVILSLIVATPAVAGNLTFDQGQTAWHTTQCQKPMPPSPVASAHPETQGEEMNSLINQHNAFVDAAQGYMNCISNEADRDQVLVNQAIAGGAQREIAQMQAQVVATTPQQRN